VWADAALAGAVWCGAGRCRVVAAGVAGCGTVEIGGVWGSLGPVVVVAGLGDPSRSVEIRQGAR
jgi:hypothetical protein